MSDRRLGVDNNSDGVADFYKADLTSANDFYPFGGLMPGRSYNSTNYRYSFNGKEKDPEGMGGGGATYDYGFRIYNPQIAKFLSVDPLTKSYPHYTPYAFAGNKPVWAIDQDGLEEQVYQLQLSKNNKGEPVLAVVFVEEVNNILPDFLEPDKITLMGTDGHKFYFEFESLSELYKTIQGKTQGEIKEASDRYQEIKLVSLQIANAMNDNFQQTMHDAAMSDANGPGIDPGDGLPSNTVVKSQQQTSKPTEAYNRKQHYGNTPTKADRKFLGAQKGDDVDHKTSLVKHYYEGDGKGGQPGYSMTKEERRSFATDRSNMRVAPAGENRSDGAKMTQYSKEQKEKHGLQK